MKKTVNSMRPSAFSTLLIFMALSVLGGSLLFELPLTLVPVPRLARVYVQAQYPEASPLQVEKQLTALLEAGLASLSEIDKISSVSDYGRCRIQIDFEPETDIDFKMLEIRAVVQGLMPQLPPTVAFPRITHLNPSQQRNPYFLSYSIQSPESRVEMEQLLRPRVQALFSLLQGLQAAELEGATPNMLKISLDETRMHAYGISYTHLLESLRALNRRQELGHIQQGQQHLQVLLQNQSLDPDALARLVVGWRNEQAIHLADVASWKLAPPRAERFYRINGQESLSLSFRAEEGANLLELAATIYPKIELLAQQLPPGYSLIKQQDETTWLRKETHKLVQRSMLALGLLLCSLLLFTRNLRYAAILLLSLVANLALAVILFYLLDLQLHLYSLAGFTVSLGMMVDNSILMIDTLRKNEQHPKGSLHAFLPILAATLTTLVSLITVYFLPDELKANLYTFCLTVAICLCCSLLVAWLLIPALCERFGLRQRPPAQATSIGRWQAIFPYMLRFRLWMFVLLVWAFGLPTYLLPGYVEGDSLAAQLYNSSIGSDFYQKELRPHIDKWLGGSSRLFYYYVFDRYSYGEPGQTTLHVSVSLPNGYTASQVSDLLRPLEQLIAPYRQGITFYETVVPGSRGGRMRILFNQAGEAAGLHFRLKSLIEGKVIDYSGTTWQVWGVGKGFSTGGGGQEVNFMVNLRGYNYQQLEDIAQGIADSLLRHPRVQEVDLYRTGYWGRRPEERFLLRLHPAGLALRNLSPAQVATSLRFRSLNEQANGNLLWHGPAGSTEVPFMLKQRGYQQANIQQLMRQPIPIDSQYIQLAAVSTTTKQPGLGEVLKEDQQYLRTLRYQYFGSHKFGRRHLDRVLSHWKALLPAGYEAEVADSMYFWGSRENKRWQYLILGLVIAGIFVICAAFFESLRYALMVLSIIPMAYIGSFLTFYLFDIPFDQGAFASFLLLAGLTVNHLIFLLYAIRRLPRPYQLTAVWQVMAQKALPIVLTVISTCAGLAPMLLDQDPFWYAFASGAIGGLLLATAMIFLYIPLFLRYGPPQKTSSPKSH